MVGKVLLAFALLAVVLEALPRVKQGKLVSQCQNIPGKPCGDDSDCCGPLICNRKSRCGKMNFVEMIMRRKPCYRHVFKKSCSSDSECLCNEGELVCENNECVQPKRTTAIVV